MKRIIAVLAAAALLSALLCACGAERKPPLSSEMPRVTANVTSSPAPATPGTEESKGGTGEGGMMNGGNANRVPGSAGPALNTESPRDTAAPKR
ncbi:MAG: hypothetical protein K5855_09700 [Oscillospiraceae bacterium]|jgi:hypothetical protein|nr:hypothetical protein [Oscillospiraceae bacterium]